jgi:hypothetical protein
MLVLGKVLNPLRNLLNNLINDLLDPSVNSPILRHQIASMETARNDLHGNILGILQRSLRPQIRRNRSLAPRIELAVYVDQAGRVHVVPPVRVAVDVFLGAAFRNTVFGPIRRWREIESALADPVVRVDKTGDDRGAIARGAGLPVTKGLIAGPMTMLVRDEDEVN